MELNYIFSLQFFSPPWKDETGRMKYRGVLCPDVVVLLVLLLRERAVTLRDESAAEGRDIVM